MSTAPHALLPLSLQLVPRSSKNLCAVPLTTRVLLQSLLLLQHALQLLLALMLQHALSSQHALSPHHALLLTRICAVNMHSCAAPWGQQTSGSGDTKLTDTKHSGSVESPETPSLRNSERSGMMDSKSSADRGGHIMPTAHCFALTSRGATAHLCMLLRGRPRDLACYVSLL